MPIFGTGTKPANVERNQDVEVTPKQVKKKGQGNGWTRFWKSVNSFDALAWFEPKRPPPVPRDVFIDLPLPETIWEPTRKGKKQLKDGVPANQIERKVGKQASKAYMYPSNQVLTSKYNVITFIPKNLLEQFRRIANIFFLILTILQFFPQFTQVSPFLAALPLLVVLAVTALKDGYEDIKRHQSDRFINNLGCHVLAGPNVLNPNLTTPKSRGISMRWLGDLFPWIGSIPFLGTGRATKKAAKESERAAAREAALAHNTGGGLDTDDRPDDFDAAERASMVGGGTKRSWWGKKKRPVPASRVRGLSNAADKEKEKEKEKQGGGPGKIGADGMSQPKGVQRVETFLVDDDDQHHPTRQQQQQQQYDVPADRHLSMSDGGHSHGSAAARPPAASTEGLPATAEFTGSSPDKAHWKKTRWEDVKVGDFVRLRDNDSIPADVIICATSEEENICYVETKNLDGETNLKARSAIPELTHVRNARAASEARFVIKSEAPDVNMFKYNAAIELHDGQVGKDGGVLRAPVNLNTVLLRGTVLRNTEWVIGVVVFTGIDTKIVMNSGGTPSKRSRVERMMNPMVFLNLFLLALMCIMCTVGDHFEQRYYLAREAYWEFDATRKYSVNTYGLITFANAMITFQNIVPISLYISIEFVRTVQALYIWGDDEIKYGLTGRRTIARSWNLSDDLGQIEYIFSDKTGTLTQNSMQFRHCTIGGRQYKGDDQLPENTIIPEKHQAAPGAGAAVEQSQRQDDLENQELGGRSNASSSGDETRVAKAAANIVDEDEKKQVKLPAEVVAPFHDAAIDTALTAGDEQSKRITMFFTNLGLCHTVLAAEDGEGHIEYKAQSPDEAALVQAAADVGFVFRGRDREILNLQVPGSDSIQKYELLETLEFTSARKRMSVLLRRVDKHDGDEKGILLFSKGADNVIFERLVPGDEEFKKITDTHLQDFASEGLRTLTLAYKYLPEEEYEDWSRKYHNATLVIDNRDAEMEKVAAEIEGGLRLLGATAIEDKLQDGVPEAIADLKRAGIKVWVATGDKLETAIAIGMSSNLLAKDMNLIIIRGGEYGSHNSAYDQLRKALINYFDGREEVDNAIEQPPGLERTHSHHGRPSLMLRRSTSRRRSQRSMPGRRDSIASGLSEFIDEDNGSKPGGFGLVIDGGSLQHALAEDYSKELLLKLATRCKSVICCRVSPLQKALIVKLVKEGLGAMCLAIGDGANDVSMIQAADVGVGVAGEEGLQAVNSSDYAIAQFRFLTRLLFIHGHWSYMRNSSMICNFFYKEIIGIGILFFFQFYCAFSTTTVYEYTLLLFWNVFWTLLPVLAIGIFDRSMDQHVIMQVPEIYRYGIENRWFGLKRFCIYMADGVYASAICFFFLLYTYNTTTARKDGYEVYIYEFSTVMCIIAVINANFYNGLNTKAWNWWVLGSVLVGPVLILCYTAVYAAISPGWIWTTFYGLNHFLWGSAYFWFGMLFCFFVSLIPKYFMRYWNELYRATDVDILAYIAKRDPHHDFAHDPMFPAARERRKYMAGSNHPDEGLPMQTLAQQGRRMTDRSGRLVPVSSRGFAFDEDPYPRRSTSRPGSLVSPDETKGRKRSHSIKLGPVNLPVPHIRSPNTLRKKKHSNTISTLPEQPETETPRGSRFRSGTGATAGGHGASPERPSEAQQYSQAYAGSPSRSMAQQATGPNHSPTAAETSFSSPTRQLTVDPPTEPALKSQDRSFQVSPSKTGTTPHLFIKEDGR